MDLLSFPGAAAMLARHQEVLPQPDQMCGPFSTHVVLHALLDAPPSVVELAVSAGTRIWPADVAEWRPPGVPLLRLGWGTLAHASAPGRSGTDAAGVAASVTTLTELEVVPVSSAGLTREALQRVLAGLLDGPHVGVVANIHTRAMDPGADLAVGHFVALWGCSSDGASVGVADTYAELGAPDGSPGCRVVTVEALHAGLSAPPGRGLLLIAAPYDAPAVLDLVVEAGASTELWST